MSAAIEGFAKVLAPGRYAVFVVGDAIFKGEKFSTSKAISSAAENVGLEIVGVIGRPIHRTKRSFAKPARRARSEQLVVLRSPNRPTTVRLYPPRYRMWPYEEELRTREIEGLIGDRIEILATDSTVTLRLEQPALWHTRRLAFTHDLRLGSASGTVRPTWQNVLENGNADSTKRKDPKYVTHGLHPFKGKFYPQLVKSLINISGTPVASRLFDPYCGSGTTLLEGMLNGYSAYGCDFNPLAAKIAHAKTAILTVPRDLVDLSIRAMLDRPVPSGTVRFLTRSNNFSDATHQELFSWFPEPVLHKLNWLLSPSPSTRYQNAGRFL